MRPKRSILSLCASIMSHTAVIASSVGMFPYKFWTSMVKMMVPGGSEHGNLSFMAERYCSVFFRCAGIKGRSWVTILRHGFRPTSKQT